MGASNFDVEANSAQRKSTHESSQSSFPQKIDIPHAHTVGRKAPGRLLRITLGIFSGFLCLGMAYAPLKILTAAMTVFTAFICLQAVLRIAATLCSKTRFEVVSDINPFTRTGAMDWPQYSVLVPLKDEAHMVSGLINTLSKLDYPPNRLQIIFITEEDDPTTRRAVTAALRPPFEQVVVPRRGEIGPRTKPHALNIAMLGITVSYYY